MAFRLQRDRATVNLHIALFESEFFGVGIAFVVLRLGIGNDRFSIDRVRDEFISAHFDLDGDPLIAPVSFRYGVGAVPFE